MGAFGRLLIQRWGGDLEAYDGHGSTSKPEKPKVESDRDFEKSDEMLLERIKNASEETIRRGEAMLKQINATGVYRHFETEKGMADFEIWKNKFMNKLED